MDFTNNSDLIKSLGKGDEKAYMFLLDKYHRRLYGYAMSLINDHTLAEDIVQNVFLKTWQHRKKLNAEFSIQSFLYKSIYNEFINSYKKDKSVMMLQMKYYQSLAEVVENSDDKMIEKMIHVVTKEIEKLPPKCREIFSLSKKEGLSNIEIAEYLNISPKTVEAQITKAFNVLRISLKHKYNTILFLVFGMHSDENDVELR
ncbi:RNA polymerase sigma-70 factor [Cellulophaga sp. HaHaR_3_176]|uniref:RNA polymerase sigma factor n=1 Tax=Cellulophaga sp. HaHaR_3_176 TaxID=1942464 RepID=UPI001C1F73A4|nr:RNA polymerase sigma-70 factor [Cellulophaga sp. HaHaR_3_176]QWX84624.1 RNA polymerase sigma-70 factor [Cellulophaga sp. HaHaR_3_176]